MNSNRQLVILLTSSVVALVILIIYAMERKAANALPPPLPSRLLAEWKGARYVSISNNETFAREIHESVSRVLAADSSLQKLYIDALTDAIRRYLIAYHTGRFSDFWRFCCPTGLCEIEVNKSAAIFALLRDAGEAHGKLGSNVIQLAEDARAERVMELYWRLNWKARFDANRPIEICTSCFKKVALEKLGIRALPDRGVVPDMMSIINRQPKIGWRISLASLRVTPTLESARIANGGDARFILVTIPIMQDTGYITLQNMILYWDSQGRRFIPILLGAGDPTRHAPALPF